MMMMMMMMMMIMLMTVIIIIIIIIIIMYSSLFSTQKLPLVNMPSFSVKFSYVSSSSWMVI